MDCERHSAAVRAETEEAIDARAVRGHNLMMTDRSGNEVNGTKKEYIGSSER